MAEHKCAEGIMPDNNTPGAAVKVLGSGCDRCKKLGANAIEALEELGFPGEVEYILDPDVIFDCGVMKNPGFMVDNVAICEGLVLNKDEIVKIIKAMRGLE